MHIVEIPSFFPPYGGEFCLEQAGALQRRGHQVGIVSNVQLSVKRSLPAYFSLPYGRQWDEREGMPLYYGYQRGVPRVIRFNVHRWVTIVRSMFGQYVARHGEPDVLHAHCAKWAGYAAMLLGREWHIPDVITEHMPLWNYQEEFGPAPSKAWQVSLLREAYEQAACVIGVSEELQDDLSCYFGRNYRYAFISNLIDTRFYHYQPRQRAAGEPFRFVCPAIYTWRKGYDVLLAAMGRMRHSHVELHVAGSGTDGKAFRHLLDGSTVAGRVTVHGALDKTQMRDLLWQCHAVALATRGEVQPLSLLEAMSTGIPYVSTQAVPRCERCEGTRVVPVDDVEAFAAAMDAIVDNSAVDGKAISEWVKRMASEEIVAAQIESVLQAAVSASAR